MKVLLTGGNGFIGSYVTDALLDLGIEVGLLLRPQADLWRLSPTNLKRCALFFVDFNHLEQHRNSLAAFKPNVWVHMAWAGVTNQYRNDLDQITINIKHAENLCSLMISLGVKKIIGIGSQAEYGPSEKILSETDETKPTTLYGVAKLSVCHLLRVLCANHHVGFVWHRVFSSYGPKDNPGWMIPMLITTLLKGESPELTLGTQQWDYIYVEDAARAIVSSIVSEKTDGIFNLASGETYTIKSVALLLQSMINTTIPFAFGVIPFRPDQVMYLRGNINKIVQATGWRPQVSLEEGLRQTVRWYQYEHNKVIG